MKIIANNKRANHDNEIIKIYEAGLVLTGSEVKSIRNQNPSIKGSFAFVQDGEIFLINANIPEYLHSSKYSHEESNSTRKRKLLLNKKEIKKINQFIKEQKAILVPLKMYWNNKSKIKIEIALAKPLKKYDKREKEKEKSFKKETW